MTDPDLIRFIHLEIKKQANVLLTAKAGKNDKDTESITNMYAGMVNQSDRPIMMPYGLVSRAMPGTDSLVARLGDHPANRYTLGHLDKTRPDVTVGNTTLYNAFGAKLVLDLIKVKIGSEDADEPLILGNVMLDFLGQLLDAIVALTVVSSAPGLPSSPPINLAQFELLKVQFVTLKTLVSKACFTQEIITPSV